MQKIDLEIASLRCKRPCGEYFPEFGSKLYTVLLNQNYPTLNILQNLIDDFWTNLGQVRSTELIIKNSSRGAQVNVKYLVLIIIDLREAYSARYAPSLGILAQLGHRVKLNL